MTLKETDLMVSIINHLIEAYCNKYPEDYDFDLEGIGYDLQTLEIMGNNGDDLESVLDWVFTDILTDLIK